MATGNGIEPWSLKCPIPWLFEVAEMRIRLSVECVTLAKYMVPERKDAVAWGTGADLIPQPFAHSFTFGGGFCR